MGGHCTRCMGVKKETSLQFILVWNKRQLIFVQRVCGSFRLLSSQLCGANLYTLSCRFYKYLWECPLMKIHTLVAVICLLFGTVFKGMPVPKSMPKKDREETVWSCFSIFFQFHQSGRVQVKIQWPKNFHDVEKSFQVLVFFFHGRGKKIHDVEKKFQDMEIFWSWNFNLNAPIALNIRQRPFYVPSHCHHFSVSIYHSGFFCSRWHSCSYLIRVNGGRRRSFYILLSSFSLLIVSNAFLACPWSNIPI